MGELLPCSRSISSFSSFHIFIVTSYVHRLIQSGSDGKLIELSLPDERRSEESYPHQVIAHIIIYLKILLRLIF